VISKAIFLGPKRLLRQYIKFIVHTVTDCIHRR
jgi:hypothetical protein